MNRDLYALITNNAHRTLAPLACALRRAERQDYMPIWRSFIVRTAR